MSDFYDWSTTAATNASSDSTINWAENQAPDTVNDSARNMMKRIAEWRTDLAPARTSAGSGNAYTATSAAGGTGSYRDNEIVAFIANRANTSSATLNVNSRGAVPLRPAVGVEFKASEIQANTPVVAFYRASTNEFLAANTGYFVNALTSGLLAQSVASRLARIGDPVLSINPTVAPGRIRLTESTQTLNKADWPELSSWLAGLSTPYPWGSAATTFNLPPAAGYFLRFAALTSGVDPDGARTAGSTQTDQNKAHAHSGSSVGNGGSHSHTFTGTSMGRNGGSNGGQFAYSADFGGTTTTSTAPDHTHTLTIASDGGTEARPKNVAMHVEIIASTALSAGTIAVFGWPLAWDTGTSAADPGTARVRGDNATLGSIANIYISEADAWGADITGVLGAITAGALIKLSKIGAQSNYLLLKATAAPTDAGSYRSIPVSVVAAVGSLSNNDSLAFEFTPATLLSSSTAIGYSTGAGGTVTQATSRTTGVTLNKACGAITLVSAAGTTSWQSFTLTNSYIAANDTVRVCQQSGTDLYQIHVTNVGSGSCKITFATISGTTTEQPVFNFSVLKGVAA